MPISGQAASISDWGGRLGCVRASEHNLAEALEFRASHWRRQSLGASISHEIDATVAAIANTWQDSPSLSLSLSLLSHDSTGWLSASRPLPKPAQLPKGATRTINGGQSVAIAARPPTAACQAQPAQ